MRSAAALEGQTRGSILELGSATEILLGSKLKKLT
jgi:hypothetical protein